MYTYTYKFKNSCYLLTIAIPTHFIKKQLFIYFVLVCIIMVNIVEKTIGNKKAYYLHQTIRTKDGYASKEKYIGSAIPENIDNIRFDFFLDLVSSKLNEIDTIKEKKEKETKRMPAEIKEKELSIFSVKFTYNTNRIEGNTLSFKDTSLLLLDNITPSVKSSRDIKETEAHQKLFLELVKKEQKITYQNLLEWHYQLFKDTKPGVAGKIRDYQVSISNTKFLPPTPIEIGPELKDFFSWYSKNKAKLHPVVLAALCHLKLVTIHPFGDGNGRITRLIMNIVLNNYKYPLYIIDYKDRKSYYSSLEFSQIRKEDIHFLNWFIKNYFKFVK